MSVATVERVAPEPAVTRDGARLWTLWGVVVMATIAMSLPNLLDPMIRFDDFPALLAEPDWYWSKTLSEGRWLNHIWHMRPVVTPSWVNFALYQVLWAGFAATLAALATGRNSGWFTVALALAIVVAPQATLISLWFNTLLPGLAVVALFALLACRMAVKGTRLLMPVFVVLTFMSYPTYPLLILAICLVQTRKRGMRDLLILLTGFAASLAVAVLATYGLNYVFHGVFGVVPADWRQASAASDLAGFAANLPLFGESLVELAWRSSFEFGPAVLFHAILFIGSTIVLLRRAGWEAIYLHAGLWTGMAIVAVQTLKMGVIVPPRAYIFAWVFYVVLIVRAAQVVSLGHPLAGRLARNAVALVVASYLLQTFLQYSTYRDWQAETRDLSVRAERAGAPVVFLGDVMRMPSARAALVQNPLALSFRLLQLTGVRPSLCALTPSACTDPNLFRIDLPADGSSSAEP